MTRVHVGSADLEEDSHLSIPSKGPRTENKFLSEFSSNSTSFPHETGAPRFVEVLDVQLREKRVSAEGRADHQTETVEVAVYVECRVWRSCLQYSTLFFSRGGHTLFHGLCHNSANVLFDVRYIGCLVWQRCRALSGTGL